MVFNVVKAIARHRGPRIEYRLNMTFLCFEFELSLFSGSKVIVDVCDVILKSFWRIYYPVALYS